MGYYDGSRMAMWQVARRYTLADNFFMGAFGGSFLNHQYLVCACARRRIRTPMPALAGQGPDLGDRDSTRDGRIRLAPAATAPASSALAGRADATSATAR